MNKTKKIVIVASLAISLIVFIIIGGFWKKDVVEPNKEQKLSVEISETIDLLSRDSSQDNITFSVTPIDFNDSVKFEIKIDTHSGSLDFDLTEVSILEDNRGNRYDPLTWDGSPSGGHHRSGVITFPKLNEGVENIRLIIKDNLNSPSRIFDWELK